MSMELLKVASQISDFFLFFLIFHKIKIPPPPCPSVCYKTGDLFLLALGEISCLFRQALRGYSVTSLPWATHWFSQSLRLIRFCALLPWASCFTLTFFAPSGFMLHTCIHILVLRTGILCRFVPSSFELNGHIQGHLTDQFETWYVGI